MAAFFGGSLCFAFVVALSLPFLSLPLSLSFFLCLCPYLSLSLSLALSSPLSPSLLSLASSFPRLAQQMGNKARSFVSFFFTFSRTHSKRYPEIHILPFFFCPFLCFKKERKNLSLPFYFRIIVNVLRKMRIYEFINKNSTERKRGKILCVVENISIGQSDHSPTF
jgi:hypothetical protein